MSPRGVPALPSTGADRLAALRHEIAASEQLDRILKSMGRLRELASALADDAALFDRCVSAIVAAERKCGRLLLAGAGDEAIGARRVERWKQLAELTESEFANAVAQEAAAMRERRQAMAAGAKPAARMLVTRWHRGNGVLTRFVVGIGLDDDAAAVERQLWIEELGTPPRDGRAA